MEGRKPLLWPLALLFCAGCFGGGAQTTTWSSAPSPPPKVTPTVTTVVESASQDPKRAARVLVATAQFKENEAKTADKEPERQFKLRDEARIGYQEALKIDPSCAEAYRGLGRIYVELGDYQRAQEVLKKAIAKYPKEAVFWYELGQMHNRKRDFAQALTCLNKAVELDPENRSILTTLGLTLARTGKIEESLAILSRSMGAASAHYNVGRMLVHLNRPEEGIRHIRQAVQLNPHLQGAQQMLRELESGGRPSGSAEIHAGT